MKREIVDRIKTVALGEVSGFARRDSGVDELLEILIKSGILELAESKAGDADALIINKIHNHRESYTSLGEVFLGVDDLEAE